MTPWRGNEAADGDSPKADEAEPINGLTILTEVEHRFRHIVDATKDQSNLDQHNDRWVNADERANKNNLLMTTKNPSSKARSLNLKAFAFAT